MPKTPTADEIEAAILAAARAAAERLLDSLTAHAAELPPAERTALEATYPTISNTAATNFEAGARWCLMYLTQAFPPARGRSDIVPLEQQINQSGAVVYMQKRRTRPGQL